MRIRPPFAMRQVVCSDCTSGSIGFLRLRVERNVIKQMMGRIEASAIVVHITLVALVLSACSDSLDSKIHELTQIDSQVANKDVREKISEYQGYVKANPSDATAIGNLGIVYELHGLSDAALDAYEIAEQLARNEFKWPYYRALLLAKRFERESALVQFNKAIALQPNYGPAWIQKGTLQLEAGALQEALSSFQQAAEVTDDPYTHVGQALVYLELDEPKKALALINELGEFGEERQVQRMKANALIRTGEVDRGSQLLANLPKGEPIGWDDPVAMEKWQHSADNVNTSLIQVVSLIRAQNYERALLILADLKAKMPDNKHVLHLLSNVYEARGNYGEALKVAQRGIELHPDFYVFRTSAANILKAMGNVSAAFEHLDAAIEIAPNLHWAYVDKAKILMELKRWDEASEYLGTAIELKSDEADLYTHRGICFGFMNRWREAAELFRVALAIDDKHVPSYINLARAETFLNNEEEASNALNAARVNGASDSLIAAVEEQRKQIKQMKINRISQ